MLAQGYIQRHGHGYPLSKDKSGHRSHGQMARQERHLRFNALSSTSTIWILCQSRNYSVSYHLTVIANLKLIPSPLKTKYLVKKGSRFKLKSVSISGACYLDVTGLKQQYRFKCAKEPSNSSTPFTIITFSTLI